MILPSINQNCHWFAVFCSSFFNWLFYPSRALLSGVSAQVAPAHGLHPRVPPQRVCSVSNNWSKLVGFGCPLSPVLVLMQVFPLSFFSFLFFLGSIGWHLVGRVAQCSLGHHLAHVPHLSLCVWVCLPHSPEHSVRVGLRADSPLSVRQSWPEEICMVLDQPTYLALLIPIYATDSRSAFC